MQLANQQGEKDLIGLILSSPDLLYRADRLRPDHFYDGRHKTIWTVMERLVEKGKAPHYHSVKGELQSSNQIDDAGGPDYISDAMAGTTAYPSMIEDIVDNIVEFSQKRDLRWHARQLESMINEGSTLQEIIEKAQLGILEISDSSVDNKPVSYGEGLTATLEAILATHKSGNLPGITSGFTQLDDVTNGFKGGDLIILGGRPSMGKSAFALHLARESALSGSTSALFSYEMTVKQWLKRAMASACNIDHQIIERGPLSGEDLLKLRLYIDQMQTLPLHITPTFGYSLVQLGSLMRRLKIEKGLKLAIVDYVQMIRSTNKSGNPNYEVQEITRGLKQLALQLDMPIIALSQLSRKLEGRENKRPMLSDLRDSGSVEQDADIVLFVHREEYYNPETPKRGEIEIIVAKNRSGSLGTINLLFQKSTQIFMEPIIGRTFAA